MLERPSDSLQEWMDFYQQMAVANIRSEAVPLKNRFHLDRFHTFFEERCGQEKINSCLKRDVMAWPEHLRPERLAASTINRHMASLVGFAA